MRAWGGTAEKRHMLCFSGTHSIIDPHGWVDVGVTSYVPVTSRLCSGWSDLGVTVWNVVSLTTALKGYYPHSTDGGSKTKSKQLALRPSSEFMAEAKVKLETSWFLVQSLNNYNAIIMLPPTIVFSANFGSAPLLGTGMFLQFSTLAFFEFEITCFFCPKWNGYFSNHT